MTKEDLGDIIVVVLLGLVFAMVVIGLDTL